MPVASSLPVTNLTGATILHDHEALGSLEIIHESVPGFGPNPLVEPTGVGTRDFRDVSPDVVLATIYDTPIALIVLRAVLGFTPPEWAYVTTQQSGTPVPQGAARSIDRKIRTKPLQPMTRNGGVTDERIAAMVTTACRLLADRAPEAAPGVLHRLELALRSVRDAGDSSRRRAGSPGTAGGRA